MSKDNTSNVSDAGSPQPHSTQPHRDPDTGVSSSVANAARDKCATWARHQQEFTVRGDHTTSSKVSGVPVHVYQNPVATTVEESGHRWLERAKFEPWYRQKLRWRAHYASGTVHGLGTTDLQDKLLYARSKATKRLGELEQSCNAMQDLSKKLTDELVRLDECPDIPVDMARGHVLEEWRLYEEIVESINNLCFTLIRHEPMEFPSLKMSLQESQHKSNESTEYKIKKHLRRSTSKSLTTSGSDGDDETGNVEIEGANKTSDKKRCGTGSDNVEVPPSTRDIRGSDTDSSTTTFNPPSGKDAPADVAKA